MACGWAALNVSMQVTVRIGNVGRPSKEIDALPTDQSSRRAAKSRLAFLCHAIPDKGCVHLPFISFNALLCDSSPLETISFKCLSCALMT